MRAGRAIAQGRAQKRPPPTEPAAMPPRNPARRLLSAVLCLLPPVAHAYSAHDAIPGSRLEIFEQSRHFPHQDEPVRFASVLLEFLRTTEPAPFDRTDLRTRLAGRENPASSPA